ncbi:MAG: hypothetical protein A2Y79_09660 [Deltaproteobacteria bacterium RBG_13_43_22]|nr:MAG: hypothetical protein A2Y79_09660 [Deltaproteobacteria bacterium RBG_13_43_22]
MALFDKMIKGLQTIFYEVRDLAQREIRFYQGKPYIATLFLTYRCNSHCKTCTAWKRPAAEEIRKEIGIHEWKLIIDKLEAEEVRIAEIFGGNVLLRKDLLISVLQYLHAKNFIIHLPTNQIGLDEEIAQAIVSTVDYLYISTDGVGEYQDLIRGQIGASQRVEDSISMLIRLRNNAKIPRLICNTTVSKFNVNILDKIVAYACSNGFDEIYFEYAGEFSPATIDCSMINGIRPSPYIVKQEETVLVDRQGAHLLKENLRKIKERYQKEPIKIGTVNIDILSERHLYEGTIPHGKCYVERNEVTIDPYGNIVACPFINNYMMGNLVSNTLGEIWNKGKHQTFREQQNGGKLAMCPHCILGVQRNPGIWTSLRRIYFQHIQPRI